MCTIRKWIVFFFGMPTRLILYMRIRRDREKNQQQERKKRAFPTFLDSILWRFCFCLDTLSYFCRAYVSVLVSRLNRFVLSLRVSIPFFSSSRWLFLFVYFKRIFTQLTYRKLKIFKTDTSQNAFYIDESWSELERARSLFSSFDYVHLHETDSNAVIVWAYAPIQLHIHTIDLIYGMHF